MTRAGIEMNQARPAPRMSAAPASAPHNPACTISGNVMRDPQPSHRTSREPAESSGVPAWQQAVIGLARLDEIVFPPFVLQLQFLDRCRAVLEHCGGITRGACRVC